LLKKKETIRMNEKIKGGLALQRLQRINPLMENYVANTRLPGIVTLLYRKGDLAYHRAFGYLDPDQSRPLDIDAIFRLYSMTKPIICVALLTLYEQGKFQLFDPVSWYIPGFSKLKVFCDEMTRRRNQVNKRTVFRASNLVDPIREVTVCDLLTHTSGLTYSFLENGAVEDMYRENEIASNKPLEEFVEDLLQMPLAFHPGSEWRYSFSHDVVARLIEVLGEQPLHQFLDEKIFQPLNMPDTAYYVPAEKQDRFVSLIGAGDSENPKSSRTWELADQNQFRRLSNPEKDLEYHKHEIFRGGHGLVSTAADYLQFCRMLLNHGELDGARILGRKTIELMTTNHLPQSLLPFDINGNVFKGYGYGLGVRVLIDLGRCQVPGSLGEYGWGGAASTYFWIDPVEEFIGIVLSQLMPEGYYAVSDDFRVLAYQAIVD
jgi:CubicO group peptidase (beta-lactamase class C family)